MIRVEGQITVWFSGSGSFKIEFRQVTDQDVIDLLEKIKTALELAVPKSQEEPYYHPPSSESE